MTAERGRPVRRVAALYDIHGNLPALEAVLAEVHAAEPDLIVVGGDVAPGPLVEGCMDLLLDLGRPALFLHGNGDRDVLTVHRGGTPERVPEAYRGMMRWVADRLAPDHLDAIASWPRTVQVDVAGLGPVLFCHATPRDDNELFTARTSEDRLRPAFAGVDEEVALVVCGHTHVPFDRSVDGLRVVNAGSVGMPFGPPEAAWLLVGPDVEPRRTSYDLDAAAARLESSGYPPEFDVRNPPSAEAMTEAFEAAALR